MVKKPHKPSTTMEKVKPYQRYTIDHPLYPPRLQHLGDPPRELFILGVLPDPDRPHLAVVGTRRATPYGIQVTRELVTPLARAGIVIVSGLAYGIDAEAHRAALDAGGTTVAVVGTGIDRVYPAAHERLAHAIGEHGALVSEYPMGTPPLPHHFPERNRILAALAHAVLVVEAPLKSGALITAYGATEIGRDVLAVPGPLHSAASAGCHGLIARGARIVTGVEDILETLGLDIALASRQNHEIVLAACSAAARKILAATGTGAPTLDELSGSTLLPTERVLAAVTELEVAGLIRNLGDGRYASATPNTQLPNAGSRHRRITDESQEN